MQSALEKIRINGLHGCKTINVAVQDNTLVLVGENGSGKTTFLRILFHVLSGRWLSLVQYRFDTIELTISGRSYTIEREAINSRFAKIDKRLLSDLPPSVRNRLIELAQRSDLDRVPAELERLTHRYGVPVEFLVRQLNLLDDAPRGFSKEVLAQIKQISSDLNAQILYLPTYRRIERELSSIFEGVDPDDLRRTQSRILQREPERERAYIELVEFGMQDVERAIKHVLDRLKDFARESSTNLTLKYLGDVVDQQYLRVGLDEIAQKSEEIIRSVLDRIDESILSVSHKEHLFKAINSARSRSRLNEHEKLICHYFLKLLSFQESLKSREQNISVFCALCSDYIVDKKFVYNPTDFTFSIVPTPESGVASRLELSDLSSGEKQIVSLFSHLYLSGNKRFFVLIDEPELSLSVPWQRRFLTDIRNGEFCSGLVAVTHSPFIYDNELRKYAHSLGEFVFSEAEGSKS